MIGTYKPTAIYKPLDWQVPAFRDKSRLVLLSGSAGGGKSRIASEKAHAFAKKYPGATCLIVRKTEDSMKNSTLPFFRKVVVGEELGRTVRHIESKSRFEYANGSIVAYGGMLGEREREAVRGIGQDGGLDFVWMEEATRFEEMDYNELIARMRGKAADWTQILMSTNPDAPNHWINRRLIIGGEASVYYSGAMDNPHNPPEYIEGLKLLTGILALRLVGGKWVQAEGVVYDNFSMENVTTDAEYDPALPVMWGVDDGYSYGEGIGTASYHPRVFLLGQPTANGGMNVFAEYGRCQELSEDSIRHVLELPYKRPEIAYVDSSAAELKARLHAMDIPTVNATHRVVEGIKNVRRLMCDGQGVRLLKIHPRCVEFIREIQSYRYDDKSTVSENGERKPLKLDDHYNDSFRYLSRSVWHSEIGGD